MISLPGEDGVEGIPIQVPSPTVLSGSEEEFHTPPDGSILQLEAE